MDVTKDILLAQLAKVLSQMGFAFALRKTTVTDGLVELSEMPAFSSHIRQETNDRKATKLGTRLFEDIGEIMAEHLVQLLAENDNINPATIAQAIAAQLQTHGLPHLQASQYTSTPFITQMQAQPPTATLTPTEHDTYQRLLAETGRVLFTVADKLPSFGQPNITQRLHKSTTILAEAETAITTLQHMKVVSHSYNPEEKAANFEQDYRRLLALELNKLRLFGIPQIDDHHQPLTVAYVQLQAVAWQAQDDKTAFIDDIHKLDRMGQPAERRQAPVTTLLNENKRMVIVGRAGAGKTTLLKWIAVQAATQQLPDELAAWRGKIPFYVRVRDYVDRDFPTVADLPFQFLPFSTKSDEQGATQKHATGISSAQLNALRQALPTCGAFATNETIRAIFVDSRLHLWQNKLPQCTNVGDRVEQIINFLHDKQTVRGENALVSLIQVLHERVDAEDDCAKQLQALAKDLTTAMSPATPTPPPRAIGLPNPPEAG